MRHIDHLIVHCSATPAGRDIGAREINRWHRQRGWRGIGYHYVIRLDGTVELGRSIREAGAHVEGWNRHSIGVCLIGGVSADNPLEAKNTYTEAQMTSLHKLLADLQAQFPEAVICGHRDMPEVRKACPSFDVRAWWASVQASS